MNQYSHILINNTASVTKTSEPKDEQLCNTVDVHNIHIHDVKTPRHIIKINKNIETTAVHNNILVHQ